MTKKEYNGWTNYETWVTNLWIDNDHYLYERSREIAEDAKALPTNRERIWGIAHSLQNLIEDEIWEAGLTNSSCLAADLVNSALAEIDWIEIANHMIEEE